MFPSLKEAIGFSSEPLADRSGYTWTLTTRLGQFLREAERLFGSRDMDWTPIGIEFCGEIPQVWYPGNVKFVSIMLTDSARTNPRQALFQLAHEVVHLLSPSGGRGAPVLEEGLATWFSDNMAADLGINIHTSVASYLEAKSLTEKLLAINPEAVKLIRKNEPRFIKMSADIICHSVPGVDRVLAERLCEPFVRGA